MGRPAFAAVDLEPQPADAAGCEGRQDVDDRQQGGDVAELCHVQRAGERELDEEAEAGTADGAARENDKPAQRLAL